MFVQVDPEALAEKLTAATRAGNLADAYAVIKNLPLDALRDVSVASRFSCIPTKNRRDFLAHMLSQVTDATRRRTDGRGLREIARKAAP